MNSKTFLTTLPHFIETQCASFCWFLTTGLLDSLKLLQFNFSVSSFFELDCFSENYFFIHPIQNNFDSERDRSTFTLKLYIPIQVLLKQIDLVSNFKILNKNFLFLGEIPLMTNRGTFIVNGYEKILINQLVRSPGLYFSKEFSLPKKSIKRLLLLPQKGAWITLEFTQAQSLILLFDKNQKLNILNFLRFFSFTSFEIEEYLKSFGYLNLLDLGISTTISNSTVYDYVQSKIFNKTYYNLGIIGRFHLNRFFQTSSRSILNSTVTLTDFLQLIHFMLQKDNFNSIDTDIDNLANKHIRSISEILQFQFQYGVKRFKRELKDALNTPNNLNLSFLTSMSSKAINSVLQTFFSSSQLIQFLDQTNLLSEFSHKRRLNHFSIGATQSNLKIRDIHVTYFGRICPIETGEGSKAGLTAALAAYSRINELGMLETPFFLVLNRYILNKAPVIFLTVFEEYYFKIAPGDTPVTKFGCIKSGNLIIKFQNKFIYSTVDAVQLIPVSSFQSFSLGVSLIPFLEHNDANRVLMGASMQRQTVPLLFSHKPIVGTGLEMQIVYDSVLKSYRSGFISLVTSNFIISESSHLFCLKYILKKFKRLNQNTCFNQRAIVWSGESIKSGQILADSSETDNGELALGQNLLIAYMSWNGFNFEDSILINERLIFSDLFTSITILKFTIFIKHSLKMFEHLSSDSSFKNLDLNGLIKKGSFVKPFDILVAKFSAQDNHFLSNFLTLSVIQLNKIKRNTQNSSILATSECYGRVLNIFFCFNENILRSFSKVRFKIIILLAQLKKLEVGDKLSGRHGNKGIISKILAQEDMPYLPNGQSIDLILNPLGVPSRMNVGQLFEGLLGFAGHFLNKRFKLSPFDEVYSKNSSRILITNFLKKAQQFTKFFWIYNLFTPGKIILRDGKTGTCFDNSVLVCKSYILKLIHFVADKVQARSIGAYSLISQQPVHGKKFKGGQRFGEMEVWALEAFGALYTLQEILTIKSDDIYGRNNLLNAILTNTSFTTYSLPESFNVLLLELKSLGLNIDKYKLNSF